MVLRIFKIVVRLRDRQVLLCQPLQILNVSIILTLKQVFQKTKSFLEKLKYRFLVERTVIEKTAFPYKPLSQYLMLRQIEVQNELTRGFATNYFFLFCLSLLIV